MKKRIVSAVLSVLLICSMLLLTSCGRLTAFSLVSDALEKTNNLDSMQAKMTMDMSISTEGMTLDIPVVYDTKAAGLKSENPVSSTEMTMSVLGQEVAVDIYTEGGYFYMTAEGESVKMKAGEDTEDYDGVEMIDDMMKAVPEDILTDVVIVNNEDGTSTVTTAVSEEVFSELYGDIVDSVGDIAADGSEIGEVTLSDANIEITVNKDGYVSLYKMNFVVKMTVSAGDTAMDFTADVAATVEYVDPGKEVTVTPPDGYKDFTELDAGLAG